MRARFTFVDTAAVKQALADLVLAKQLGAAGEIAAVQEKIRNVKAGYVTDAATCVGVTAASHGAYWKFRCRLSMSDQIGDSIHVKGILTVVGPNSYRFAATSVY